MLRQILYAKIHRAVVTRCNPDYVGSIVIDPVLLEATGLVLNEKVLVADCENGSRFETYIFEGERGSGAVEVNGAAAGLTRIGHHLLIMSFAGMTPQEMSGHRPRVAVCDEQNKIAELLRYDPAPAAPAGVSDSG
jgi:aspartate 1-decarboxylase